jgi:hypothetical protein
MSWLTLFCWRHAYQDGGQRTFFTMHFQLKFSKLPVLQAIFLILLKLMQDSYHVLYFLLLESFCAGNLLSLFISGSVFWRSVAFSDSKAS